MAVKENCYWFEEDHDMGARIPFCKIKEDFQPLEPSDCESCGYYHSKYQRTRADNIRAMSDEKLAEWLYVNGDGSSYQFWLKWLRQEVKE